MNIKRQKKFAKLAKAESSVERKRDLALFNSITGGNMTMDEVDSFLEDILNQEDPKEKVLKKKELKALNKVTGAGFEMDEVVDYIEGLEAKATKIEEEAVAKRYMAKKVAAQPRDENGKFVKA